MRWMCVRRRIDVEFAAFSQRQILDSIREIIRHAQDSDKLKSG